MFASCWTRLSSAGPPFTVPRPRPDHARLRRSRSGFGRTARRRGRRPAVATRNWTPSAGRLSTRLTRVQPALAIALDRRENWPHGDSRLLRSSCSCGLAIWAQTEVMSDRRRRTKEITVVHRVPLLPLRDIVVFPHMVVPLFVGREKSISALEEATAPRQREGDLPVRPAQGEDQRADPRRHLLGRDARHDHPAAAAARRHRQGAGRGQAARGHPPLHADRRLLHGRGRGAARRRSARSSSRRWCARCTRPSRPTSS